MSFRHAVELLQSGPSSFSRRSGAAGETEHGAASCRRRLTREADDRALLLQVVGYYNETLKQSPEALKYLESRGLKSSEMIDRFKLGFANRTLGIGLPDKNRAAGAEMRGRLQRLGIFRESGHEHFNGSLVIPVFNAGRRRGARCMGGRSRRICARARPTICICRERIGACGTKKR